MIKPMEKAQVFKIHSDFYYVKTNDKNTPVIECKLKDTLKKQGLDVVVGDFVKLEELNESSRQAFISEVCPRNSFIPRPKVANVEQMIIVSAIKEPQLDLNQLDRYLALCEYHGIKPVLCFNKSDLSESCEVVDRVFDVYDKLGYEIIFTSAIEKTGLDDLEEVLKNKISALCGQSGVGKSTLINAINPDLHLKTNKLSEKTHRGTHTTRHCEIIPVELNRGKTADIIDTPGFSYLKFDFLLPKDVDSLFPDISAHNSNCKFNDCLHISEVGCGVLENIDKIAPSRYESYLAFVEEAREYKEKITYQGKKQEENFKFHNEKKVVKINTKNREKARNVAKQSIKQEEDKDE